jgi:predicted negative regulator of RcsB-dependent stress response
LFVAISVEEEESIEALKRWWNETGKLLAAGLVVAALVFLGWQQWQNAGMRASAEASAVYEQLSALVIRQPGEPVSDADRAQADNLISTLKSDHDDSVYALYGALFAARLAVEANALEEAERELRWVLDRSRSGLFRRTDQSLVLTAQLRLARVLLARGQGEEALALINGLDPQGFAAEFAELRGDIQLARGRIDEAQSAWQEAAQIDPGSPTLQMKLSNLPSGS